MIGIQRLLPNAITDAAAAITPRLRDRLAAMAPAKARAMAKVIALRSLAMTVNVGTSLLTAAVLGPGGRGEQAALVVGPGFLAGLASLGLHASLIYNIKAHPEQERELLGTGMAMTVLIGIAATIFGWIAEPYWLHQYSAHTIAVGRMLLLVTPLISLGWTLSGAAESRGWFGLANHALYLQSLATLVLLAGLFAFGWLTPTSSACAYLLPTIPVVLYLGTQIVRRMHPVIRLRPDLALRLLHYGLRLCGIDIVGTLSTYMDQLVIVAFLPASAVGAYAVALSSARLLTVIQTGVTSVLFPSIAARGAAHVVQTVAATFRAATLVIAAAAAVLSLIGPKLLLLVYGERFGGAILPLRILLFAMVIENGARILYQIYSGSGRPGVIAGFEAAAVTIAIGVMLLLVPQIGTAGAAVSVLAAASFRLLAATSGLSWLLHVKRPRLIASLGDLRAWREAAAMERNPC